jgi:23S rRNA (cytidine1920-2'-O)/16S rRNA (cytidine1409-2'-O)-methyltransferase
MRGRERLDRLLVERGLAPTREKAQALVLAGRVTVDGARADKPGQAVRAEAALEIAPGPRWVGRGALKLEHALSVLAVEVSGRAALDVGASTGGFTEALLAAGARAVVALDVGRGQLDWKLRNDPRVVPLEGANARHLRASQLPFPVSLAVVDVSFISLRTVLPPVAACLTTPGEIVALCKPQFEVGRGRVGRGGIVRDPALHREVLEGLALWSAGAGLAVQGLCASPITGAEGNVEFFFHLAPGGEGLTGEPLARAIAGALSHSPGAA